MSKKEYTTFLGVSSPIFSIGEHKFVNGTGKDITIGDKTLTGNPILSLRICQNIQQYEKFTWALNVECSRFQSQNTGIKIINFNHVTKQKPEVFTTEDKVKLLE